MENRRQSRIEHACAISGMLFVLGLALWIGVIEARHIEFDPVNGHFQNFNAEARLLAGQRPFTDFPAYLGLAPLLLPFPLFALFGGTLAASNLAYDVLSVGSVGISFALLLRLCGVKSSIAWPLAALATALPWPMEHGNDSAIGIRSFLPFAAALIILGLDRLRARGVGTVPLHVLAGIAAGLMPLWSNDYGLPCAAAFGAVFVATFTPSARSIPVAWTAFAAAAAASCLGTLHAVTGGHPAAWVAFNFGAVLGDQFWFYNPVASGKVYSLADVPHGPVEAFLALPAAVFGALWTLRRHDGRRAALAVLAVSAVGGAYVSGLAGTFQLRYFLPLWRVAIVLLPCCGFLAIRAALRLLPRNPTVPGILLSDAVPPILAAYALAAATYVFAFQARGAFWHLPAAGDVTVAELGGSVRPSYLPAITAARAMRAEWDAEGIPPARRLLSTYATATALVSGSRQSGVPDYIIHALGDEARARFAAALDDGYRAVETMDPGLMLWGGWNVRESWPFYRKLYTEWRPSSRTPWSLIWTKRAVPLPPGEILPCTVTPPDRYGFRTLSVGNAPSTEWTAEVTAVLSTSFSPLAIPIVGSHRLLEVVEGYDGADRTIDASLGYGQFSSLVTDTWTLRLADGPVSMPLRVGNGRKATLSLRAWPRERADLRVLSCSARLVAPDSETTLPETEPRGGVVDVLPHVGGPPVAEPFLARADTRAIYLQTVDPLAPARVRVGDEAVFPDGRRGRILMRDFRQVAVEWDGGPPLARNVDRITVVPAR